MTESEWLASTDPAAMLNACLALTTPGQVGLVVPGRVGNLAFRPSDRKLRLFACACWRNHPFFARERDLFVVEAIEGGSTENLPKESACFYEGTAWLLGDGAAASGRWTRQVACSGPEERAHQAALLRDLAGNPWRSVEWVCRCRQRVRVTEWRRMYRCDNCGEWNPWLTPAVLSLARAAYERRLPSGFLDPARLLVLSDALEEAGCTSAEVLGHLREPGPHARGCWATDLILGKE